MEGGHRTYRGLACGFHVLSSPPLSGARESGLRGTEWEAELFGNLMTRIERERDQARGFARAEFWWCFCVFR